MGTACIETFLSYDGSPHLPKQKLVKVLPWRSTALPLDGLLHNGRQDVTVMTPLSLGRKADILFPPAPRPSRIKLFETKRRTQKQTKQKNPKANQTDEDRFCLLLSPLSNQNQKSHVSKEGSETI